METEESCPIPYPDRFYAAIDFVSNPHPKAKALPDELRLLLFTLYKQATEGPCNEPKPWSWNVIETAKWQGWKQLGDMSKVDAMRHYVHQLEQNQPDWWNLIKTDKKEGASTEANGTEAVPSTHPMTDRNKERNQKIQEATAEGSWSTPYLSHSAKPLPRYEHGVVYVDGEMFVIGGNCAGGRYMNDVWSFDFVNLTWNSIACRAETETPNSPLPPIAGHTIVQWQDALLVVGGHVKSKDMTETMIVRVLELESMTWSILEATGEAPKPRGGHSATLLGNKIYVFGGEDIARRPLNDFYVLDLEQLEWTPLNTVKNTPPAARSAHVSTSFLDRYLLFFGGGSMATCFDDLVVFDTERQRWHIAPVRGRRPSPRAGHSAAILNDRWYIVGGGNNAAGCTDMAYLDLSQLSLWPGASEQETTEGPDLDELEYEVKWTIVGTIPERSYLASEGMSLISIQEANVLVAFGGYNGRYSNAVSLFRPRTEQPIHQYSLDSEMSGKLDSEKAETSEGDREGWQQKLQTLQAQLDAVTRNAAATKEAASQELTILRRQLISAQTMLQEKEAALNQTKELLTQQNARCVKLETEVAELRKKLETMSDLEKELEAYRQQKQVQGNKAGGIWGWVAGE